MCIFKQLLSGGISVLYESQSVSHSGVSDSLWPHGPARLLCPWNYPGRILEQVAISSSGDCSPNPWIEPRSPSLQVDSLLSEPPGKPKSFVLPLLYQRDNSLTVKFSGQVWNNSAASTGYRERKQFWSSYGNSDPQIIPHKGPSCLQVEQVQG